VEGRLAVLLDMAHTDVELLVKEVERKSQKPRTLVPETAAASAQWVVNKEGAWQGPFNLTQMTTLGWMRPETWIQRVGAKSVQMAYEDMDIRGIVNKAEGGEKSGTYQCPKCRLPLNLLTYEGTEVHKCSSCQGTLVRENDIQRIIIRQEVGFSEKIKKIAEGIRREEKLGTFKIINRDPKTLLTCPKCRHPRAKMLRMFYTEAYRVEIDKCFTCGLIWFDRDELEVLQCLIESAAEKI
jgi:Zn-finger nucleic acid-binding protein